MYSFKIKIISENQQDAHILQKCLVEWNKEFEGESPALEITVEELYGEFDDVSEIDNLACSIANALPNVEFIIDGCVDTSELSGEMMSFLIEYKNKKLISKRSDWYIYLDTDFDDYAEFAEFYEDRFTEEQFEMFQKKEYFILGSGNGDCVSKIPMEYEHEIDLNRQSICPVCGEMLNIGLPICEDKSGKQYHIWCAEDAKIEVKII